MFNALDAALKDPELAANIEKMQANVVDAVIQAMPDAEVGEAINEDLFHWEQKWPNNYTEERRFLCGKQLKGIVRIRLSSGDKVKLEAELTLPETQEELHRRDPSMQHAPGKRIITAPTNVRQLPVIPTKRYPQ